MSPQPAYVITEGVSGMYHYHVSEHQHSGGRSLCGATVMNTGLRLQDWGVPFGDHFPKRPTWCAICAQLAVPSLPEPQPESPKPMTNNPNLTPWFDGDVKPARVGVYARLGWGYSLWDGSAWRYGASTAEEATLEVEPSGTQNAPWRGLTEDPTAAPSPESGSWTPEEWARITATAAAEGKRAVDLGDEAKASTAAMVLSSYAHVARHPQMWTRPLIPAATGGG